MKAAADLEDIVSAHLRQMSDSTIAAYDVSDEQLAQFAQWTDGERLQWVWDTANFIRSLQTREERIAAYRASEGKTSNTTTPTAGRSISKRICFCGAASISQKHAAT